MSAGLKKESCYQHVSLLACYLISNPIVSCLNHFNNIISACFPKYTLFLDKKRTAIVLLSFRRRYFTMGIVKIYNVLGGFYGYYSTMTAQRSVHKLHKTSVPFLYILYSTLGLVFLFPQNFAQPVVHFPLFFAKCHFLPSLYLCRIFPLIRESALSIVLGLFPSSSAIWR